MILRDVSEGALLVEYPEASDDQANDAAVAVARALLGRGTAGILEVVPGARTVLVVFDPRRLTRDQLRAEIDSVGVEADRPSPRDHAIPVFYGAPHGPDLEDLARGASMTAEAFGRRHAAAEYRVAFLGFAPGFPYLTGLPHPLESPRLSTPRTRVPAGSVGIGGRYTGIYPEETPGGWRLIGRAPVRLFDATMDPPAMLLPGDRVRFQPIAREDLDQRLAALDHAKPAGVAADRLLLRIAAAGVMTSVQGGPRRGWARYGVPPGGAMDEEALARGNARVGNPPAAAALEMTLVGPELEFVAEATIALSGGRPAAELNGRSLSPDSVCAVRKGDVVRVGAIHGSARAYLCVAGGLARPERLTMRLGVGDAVFLDARVDTGGRTGHPAAPGSGSEARIRVFPGPQSDRFAPEGLATFLAGAYRVSEASDRRGIRLEGPRVANRESAEIPPEGTVLGAIQVPGDGQPIVLGPDRPVTGGYAKIATVVEADWSRLARAVPGTVLRFERVAFPWI